MNNRHTEHKFNLRLFSKFRGELMGLAIISIIIFHFIEDRTGALPLNRIETLYNRYFSSCGVDIFLILSGIGLYFSFRKASDSFTGRTFYIKNFLKILVPYFIIAIPFLLYETVYFEQMSFVTFLKQLFFVDFINKGHCLYWYILCICLCYLIFPFIMNIRKYTFNHLLVHCITFLVITMLCRQYCPKLYGNIEIMLMRFIPFFIGIYLGSMVYEKKPFRLSVCLPVFAIWIFMAYWKKSSGMVLCRLYFTVTALVSSVAAICILFLLNKSKFTAYINTALRFVGRYTLELYLTHVSVRSVMRLNNYPCVNARNFLIMLGISVILSIIIHFAAKPIIKYCTALFNKNHN